MAPLVLCFQLKIREDRYFWHSLCFNTKLCCKHFILVAVAYCYSAKFSVLVYESFSSFWGWVFFMKFVFKNWTLQFQCPSYYSLIIIYVTSPCMVSERYMCMVCLIHVCLCVCTCMGCPKNVHILQNTIYLLICWCIFSSALKVSIDNCCHTL
jgi:hypothetical protein